MKNRMKLISLALLGAFAAPALAASNAEIEEMQTQIRRMQVKLEALEDTRASSGLEGFKISGMIDPTFIANKRRDSAGVNFMNNFDAVDRSGVGQDSTFAYDNSYFGQALLQVEKEMEGGTKWKLALVPHKSASSGYNLGSIVHEASVSVPLTDLSTRLIAGQLPDWSGYEYYFGHQNKLVTHNLLFDFAAPSFYQGAGLEITSGKWLIKTMVGNMNKASHADGETNPVLTYRVDYAKGEYSGFGFAGQHGKMSDKHLDQFELDGYFVRGDLSFYGQIGAGKMKESAANGKDAVWTGASVYAGYKITPRFEIIARLDYIKNSKNGGGTSAIVAGTCSNLERDATTGALTGANQTQWTDLNSDGVQDDGTLAPNEILPVYDADGAAVPVRADASCADGRNGFGPGMQLAADSGEWEAIDVNKGVNRSALSLGLNYVINPNTSLKFEYRIDKASEAAFYDVKTGGYEKTNTLIGTSVVVSF